MKITWIAMGGTVLSCLTACQTMERGKAAELAVAPVESVRHGFATPDALYAVGRYFQGQRLFDRAIETYRRLLAAYPGHAEARNALGLILAAQGRYDAAVAEFEIAASDAPNSASIRNNLGYAYLLQDKPAAAIGVLKMARQLDPANRRVADNLELALARAEQKAAAGVPAAVLPAAEAAAQTVPAEGAAAAETPAAEAPSADPGRDVEPGTLASVQAQLVSVDDKTLALVFSSGTAASASAPAQAPAADAARKSARLEVANANGTAGLAGRTARELAAVGYGKARLTNQPPYQLPTTQIQYRVGFESQAQSLQSSLLKEVPIVPASALRYDIQLRLVLGRDVKSPEELIAHPLPASTSIPSRIAPNSADGRTGRGLAPA